MEISLPWDKSWGKCQHSLIINTAKKKQDSIFIHLFVYLTNMS